MSFSFHTLALCPSFACSVCDEKLNRMERKWRRRSEECRLIWNSEHSPFSDVLRKLCTNISFHSPFRGIRPARSISPFLFAISLQNFGLEFRTKNVCIWRGLSFVAKVHFECVRQYIWSAFSISSALPPFASAELCLFTPSKRQAHLFMRRCRRCAYVSCCRRFLIENTEHEKCAQAEHLTSVSQLNENNSHKMAIRNGCLCLCVPVCACVCHNTTHVFGVRGRTAERN